MTCASSCRFCERHCARRGCERRMDARLKKCPCCGAKARMRRSGGTKHAAYWVQCENAECRLMSGYSESAADAETRWNRREL